jgi:hypothetical protein
MVVIHGSRSPEEQRVIQRWIEVLRDGSTSSRCGCSGVNPAAFVPHTWDRTWLEGRREIGSFFIQEVDRDKVVLFGRP